jgi:hypothetical protein
VDEEVVDRVKVVAEVVIEQCDGLVGQRIESCDARPLFDAADTVISSRDAPVYPIRCGQFFSLTVRFSRFGLTVRCGSFRHLGHIWVDPISALQALGDQH